MSAFQNAENTTITGESVNLTTVNNYVYNIAELTIMPADDRGVGWWTSLAGWFAHVGYTLGDVLGRVWKGREISTVNYHLEKLERSPNGSYMKSILNVVIPPLRLRKL
ncbi:unnamed protein product [Cyclocybe aegerita]|uniref:Uncharacterized protein n=1 Tax=Cyclocybe aegerita TaxID=1973307 RepID=A0A8S0WZS2_CYCAE|nr:unnamed protein product [Cyclocybe aegerita]